MLRIANEREGLILRQVGGSGGIRKLIGCDGRVYGKRRKKGKHNICVSPFKLYVTDCV
jgi:hypothetical protein